MVVFPNIKINIGLNVVERRKDGFHNLETIFYPITVCDVLEVQAAEKTSITISGMEIEGNTDNNLCIKAYRHLKKIHSNLPEIKIHLHKNIPTGAGLGGGSSDAAFMLKLLNSKFNLQHTEKELEEIAANLGSDCSFFIRNKPVYAYGRGEKFDAISLDLSNYQIVIVKPPIHSNTADAFRGIQPTTPLQDLRDLIKQPIHEWKHSICNDFEKSIFTKFPEIKKIKEELYAQGAIFALMSGSGASVFGVFSKQEEIPDLKNKFQGNFFRVV